MRKVLTAAAAVAVLTVPLVAGALQGGNEAPGWEHRLDFGGDVNDLLHFRPMGDGVHATTTGPVSPFSGSQRPQQRGEFSGGGPRSARRRGTSRSARPRSPRWSGRGTRAAVASA